VAAALSPSASFENLQKPRFRRWASIPYFSRLTERLQSAEHILGETPRNLALP